MEVINATGRRKTAIARVYLKPGAGKITVNGRDYVEYFRNELLQLKIDQPFVAINVAKDTFDLHINVDGGGPNGQAEAIRLGISRALVELNEEYKPALRKEGFLTRDSRIVERKKYGHKKARKSFQFSKR